MRRVIHITPDTEYTSEAGMLFVKGKIDQTVIIAQDCASRDLLIQALQRLQVEDGHVDA